MPFLSVFRKRKPPPVQLAALLAAELQKVILAEEDKTALLAKVMECQHHEVQHHPQFAAAIQKVKELFSTWLDPHPALDITVSMAEAVAWLQERYGIASSHLFEMLRRMRHAGHQYGAPESFFEHADFFMQTVMEKQRCRHKEAFGAFGKALIIFDSHGNNVDVNDAACKLLGYSKEEMLSPSFNWLAVTATPDDAKTVENRIRRLVTSGGSAHYENQYRTKDGRIIAVLNTSSALRNGFFACCMEETTALRQKEAELEQAYTFWRMLFDQAPIGIEVYDLDGRYLYVNPLFCEMAGMTREELLAPGFDYKTLFSECLEDTMAQVENAAATGDPEMGELVITSRGQRTEVMCTTIRLSQQDSKGRPLLASFHQNIQPLRAKEAELREERIYLQGIFDSLTEGVVIFGLDGEIYEMNDAYAALVGYSQEELLQKGWLELTALEYRQEDQKRLPDIMAGIAVRFEKDYIHKNGHRVPILISYRLLHRRQGWEKDRLVATCVDLTTEKAQGAALQARINQMREVSQQLEAFAAELAENQKELAQRIEHQLASLEEISASLEEMTAVTQSQTEQSHHTLDATKVMAQAALAVTDRTTILKNKMDELVNTAQVAGDILASIGSISFQTHILSLNASVEAARAGGYGKGFSVLAAEIRNLANKSATDVKRIKQWFNDLDYQVRQNQTAMAESLAQLQTIAEQTGMVQTMVDQVVAAIEENRFGIQQIQEAVANLDRGMKNISASSDDVSAVGDQLLGTSHHLVQTAADQKHAGTGEVYRIAPKRLRGPDLEKDHPLA